MATRNKTIKAYWDGIWQSGSAAEDIDPRAPGIKNYVTRRFHEFFKRAFLTMDTGQSRLLEIGCANSAWLPYFGKEFGFDVSGLDYSKIGCERAEHNLFRKGVQGNVVCADLFSPPSHMLGNYDVVVSFGVVEHFDNTSECLEALSKFLKKDGLLITNIPNMAGCVGFLQKHLNRPVYDIHNPIDKNVFHSAHERAGYDVVECNYFISSNFWVCNLNGVLKKSMAWVMKKIVLLFFTRISMLIWVADERIARFPVGRCFSPYINCIAKKSVGSKN